MYVVCRVSCVVRTELVCLGQAVERSRTPVECPQASHQIRKRQTRRLLQKVEMARSGHPSRLGMISRIIS